MPDAYRPRKSVVHEKFGDETVIVNLDTGCYFSLQGTADAIWALAACGLNRSAIVAAISERYSGDPDAMADDILGFLDELLAEALLDVDDTQAAAARPPLAGGAFSSPRLQKYTDMEELLELDPIHEVDEIGWPSAKPAAF